MKEKERINFCKEFAEKVSDLQGFENKIRYLLDDFFFKEGWSSKTNEKSMKEGFNAEVTYSVSTLKHFIEDFVRWSKLEFKKMIKKK